MHGTWFHFVTAGTVPVYIGAPDIKEFAPPDSYIDASDMMPEELSERLQHLADNPMEYMNYHAWRRCVLLHAMLALCPCKYHWSHESFLSFYC